MADKEQRQTVNTDTGSCCKRDGQQEAKLNDNIMEETCCCKRHKQRDTKEYTDLMNRLSRIEGQVRGIKRMLEEDAYCPDILIQVSAINAALNSFNKVLLANHIRDCVVTDIREGKDETIDELITVCQKIMR